MKYFLECGDIRISINGPDENTVARQLVKQMLMEQADMGQIVMVSEKDFCCKRRNPVLLITQGLINDIQTNTFSPPLGLFNSFRTMDSIVESNI
jgi:hypothetical protein